jgi:hypothetical protein
MNEFHEPWEAGPEEGHPAGPIGVYRILRDASGQLIAHLWPHSDPDCDAHAARIVACVNACAGIPTQVLVEGQGQLHVCLNDPRFIMHCRVQDLPRFLRETLDAWEAQGCPPESGSSEVLGTTVSKTSS